MELSDVCYRLEVKGNRSEVFPFKLTKWLP